ncbi:MAG: Gfo/Idh/MocA family oxidoreductase [Balneolaceae bacterium]
MTEYSTDSGPEYRPKLGFAGVGWIGKSRLKAIMDGQAAGAVAAFDPDPSVTAGLKGDVPGVRIHDSFDDMLDSDLDGIVIATPSALHADQALSALNSGKAVFCQKPLGRNRQETEKVVETAREHDLLLGVDFSYRYVRAAEQVRKTITSGELGKIYAVHLIFHNSYGPDKAWYRDAALSGGGCLMDLGIHLVDFLFWILDRPAISVLQSRLISRGRLLNGNRSQVEDYAAAQFLLDGDTSVQLSCSWNLPAGRDAIIEACFYGENGGVSFRNVDGSFYDFVAEKYNSTAAETLAGPPDHWSGRGAAVWAERLAEENKFDPAAEDYTNVAHALDLLYQNSL